METGLIILHCAFAGNVHVWDKETKEFIHAKLVEGIQHHTENDLKMAKDKAAKVQQQNQLYFLKNPRTLSDVAI